MRYTDFIPNLKKGEELLEENRFEDTLAVCDSVLAKMPDHVGAFDLKCVCFLRMERIDEAEQAIRTAITHLDCNAVLHAHLGDVLVRQDRDEEALRAYEKAVHFDSSYVQGYTGRGRVRMFHLCDSDGAMRDFTNAIELDRQESQAWYLRGLCLLGTQRFNEAQQDFRNALMLDPGLKQKIEEAVATYVKASNLPED